MKCFSSQEAVQLNIRSPTELPVTCEHVYKSTCVRCAEYARACQISITTSSTIHNIDEATIIPESEGSSINTPHDVSSTWGFPVGSKT